MKTTTTDVRDAVVVDYGPVRNAALILAESTTLADHINVSADDGYVTTIEMWGDIPFEMWGSGTQALWRLLSAIAYTADQVSLYEVVSRLDRRNLAAVGAALAALCEVS